MTVNDFIKNNLEEIRDEIIRKGLSDKFDTHAFIRLFAKRFELEYVKLLGAYNQTPFKNLHAQIGKSLSNHQNLLQIRKDGDKILGTNIFGFESENQKWIKRT